MDFTFTFEIWQTCYIKKLESQMCKMKLHLDYVFIFTMHNTVNCQLVLGFIDVVGNYATSSSALPHPFSTLGVRHVHYK